MSWADRARVRCHRWRFHYRHILACLVLAAPLIALGWLAEDWQFHDGLKRAIVEIGDGQYRSAHPRLLALAARRPRQPDVSYHLGICEEALNAPERALKAWADVAPESLYGPRAALARAKLLFHTFGRLAEAEPLLEVALRGTAGTANPARWELFRLLVWEGRNDEARRLLERGWASAPAAERVAYLREHWRLDTVVVSKEEVEPLLEAAGRHAPADVGYRLVLATLATYYGRWDEAEQHLDAHLKAQPAGHAVWRLWLSWAVAAERPVEAARALRHLPADRLDAGDVLRLRAWFARHHGDQRAERRVLEALVQFCPGETPALERLALLAQELGDAARAARLREAKARVDQIKERYRWGLLELPVHPGGSRIDELAGLAEELGRDFEARGFRTLGASQGLAHTEQRGVPVEASPGALMADAQRSCPSVVERIAPISRPMFATRQLGDSGYRSVPSSRHQIPEVVGGGCALLDYDGDGWIDIFVVQGGMFPEGGTPARSDDRLYRNSGDGTFEDVSTRSQIASLAGGFGFGVTAGDYDGDGWTDLFLTRWRRYALFRNNGDGTFEDVSDRVGLGGERGFPTSAAFADLDKDGDLDLYVCHYLKWDATAAPVCPSARVPGRNVSCSPRRFAAEPDRLYRNDGGLFTDVTEEAGITDADGRGLGVVTADLDGDGWVDIYVANDQSPNYLFRNRGGFRFEETGLTSGAACGADGVARAGMGVTCGDLDQDGWPDLAVTNFFTESTTLYRNLGGGIFTDVSTSVGLAHASRFFLGFGVAFFDADNDGCLDLATANGHVYDESPAVPFAMTPQLLQGNGDRLTDVSAQAGSPWTEPLIGRGLAVGDLDNDGRMDVIIVPQNHPVVLARNETTRAGHFVTIRLEGTASNREAMGARVSVLAGGRRRLAWRGGGGSYLSASDPRLHFGLGASSTVSDVEVVWPSGRVTRFHDLPADRGYLVREDAPAPASLRGFAP